MISFIDPFGGFFGGISIRKCNLWRESGDQSIINHHYGAVCKVSHPHKMDDDYQWMLARLTPFNNYVNTERRDVLICQKQIDSISSDGGCGGWMIVDSHSIIFFIT